MATLRTVFSHFLSLLLLYLGCFCFATTHHHQAKKRKLIKPPQKALSSSWSYLKRIFSTKHTPPTHPYPFIPSPPSSSRSLRHHSSIVNSPETLLSDPQRKNSFFLSSESDIFGHQHFFPLRNDIYPCPICGEIFQKSILLENHQAIKHAVSELYDGDSGKNIVQIIFQTGWTYQLKTPTTHHILKIHNNPKILNRFEEYREFVKSKAAINGAVWRRDERCIADGNELLRFHCATFICDLGQNGNSSLCSNQFCSVCGIIKCGFSPKMDGISTLSTTWRAHVAIPHELEEEFKFMNVRRAMLVCRVIAGRIGSDPDIAGKIDPGFDSFVGRGDGLLGRMLDEEDELLVFNPRAVLACFVIVYTV